MAEPRRPALLAGLLLGAALLAFAAAARPLWQGDALQALLLWHGLLPRLAMGLLCGAALGLAGGLFQQVLRNPLAEPGTLGIFSGARLALAAATLWAPGLLAWGQGPVALAGAALAVGLALLLAGRQRLAPLAVILAGLMVSLAIDAGNKALVLLHYEALSDLFLSQAGGLNQNNWGGVLGLLPVLALGALLVWLGRRPLALLELEEAGARSLGLPLPLLRLLALGLAVLLGGTVAASVGAVGFIGLAGPALARMAGARRSGPRLFWGSLLGAGLLALTDQSLLLLAGPDLPAGSLTPLLGAPLLLWLLRRLRPAAPRPAEAPRRATGLSLGFVALALMLAATLGLALSLGRDVAGGWHWAMGADLAAMLPWRAPRLVAALAAGAMLGVAGLLMQRLTLNPIASPELLGVSAGAGLAMIIGVLLLGLTARPALLGLATLGAMLVLALMLALGRRSGFSPTHTLLAGATLGMLLGALTTLLLAAGDPRMLVLLGWLSGSTYAVTAGDAALAAGLAVLLLAIAPFTARWLWLLPLGPAVGQGLGLPLRQARRLLLLLAAALTATATLLVGPLSFVGLMAPHLARMLGFRRPLAQLAAAALLGGLVMALADWAARSLFFPWQLPAGLVATLLGSLAFPWLMLRR